MSFTRRRALAVLLPLLLAAADGSATEMPTPIFAVCHGATRGGGMLFPCIASTALAHADASFGFTEIRRGVLPGVWRLSRDIRGVLPGETPAPCSCTHSLNDGVRGSFSRR